MSRYEQKLRITKLAEAAAARSKDSTRHRCFISYHVDDQGEVETFVKDFGEAFFGTALGVTDDDDFVDSDDTDYIMDQIRERHLGNTTVTIVLVGKCTWARRYVDWEVYSSLRQYKSYAPSGLTAITLPSAANYSDKQLPPRVDDNVTGKGGYSRWWKYPDTVKEVRDMVDTAFDARSNKKHLIDNSRDRKKNNSNC